MNYNLKISAIDNEIVKHPPNKNNFTHSKVAIATYSFSEKQKKVMPKNSERNCVMLLQ